MKHVLISDNKIAVPVSHTETTIKSDCYNQNSHNDYNTDEDESIVVTFGHEDFDTITRINTEISRKFEPKKKDTFPLASSYQRLGYIDKSARVKDCGTFLEFARGADTSRYTLHNANFCRDRLCPLCSWRRSYKIFGQVSKIMEHIQDDFEFIFLTLTVPNVKDSELPSKIDQMQKAWINLTKHDKRFKGAVCGYFKALEVTHNHNQFSKSFDTYHPYFHTILAVDKRYYKSKDYIKQSEWLEMWRKYMKDNSITQVDVRRCTNKDKSDCEQSEKALSSAVAEVAKYATKSGDYIIPWSETLTDSSVQALLSALTGRRLCSFGGVFERKRKELKLEDAENGDLVHVEADQIRSDVALQIYRYSWSCGAYKLTAVERQVNLLIDISDDENF